MSFGIMKLKPHLAQRPWGGNRLFEMFGKETSEPGPIGESWELSDHPDGPCTIQDGPYAGRPFGEALREIPIEMIGSSEAPAKYPLLIKYIDAAEDLSIQVHPDDAYNRKHGIEDRGKTECWYIMDCDPGTEIVYGLKEGVERKDLEAAIELKTVPDCVRRIPISPGTFLYTPPGTVHAILGGTLLCEIQQSSNVTYRLWDWDRKPKRELHIEQALDCIDFHPSRTFEPFQLPQDPPSVPRITTLIHNPYFFVHAIQLAPGQSFEKPIHGPGLIVNGVAGKGTLGDQAIAEGDTFFIPACSGSVRLATDQSPLTVLLTRSNE